MSNKIESTLVGESSPQGGFLPGDFSNNFEEVVEDPIQQDQEELDNRETTYTEYEEEEVNPDPDAPVVDEVLDDTVDDVQDDFSDHDPWALVALQAKSDGLLPEDLEITKDFESSDFKEKLFEHLNTEYKDTYLKEMGFNDETLKVANYIVNGGDVEQYGKVYNAVDYSQVDVEDEAVAEELVKAYYTEVKGLRPERADILIETLKVEEEGALVEDARRIQDELKVAKAAQLKALDDQAKVDAQNRKVEQQKVEKQILNILDSGKITEEIEIPKQARKAFKDFLHKPIVMEVDGKKVKTTQYQLKNQEIQNSLEKQMLLAFMLFKDFDMEQFKAEGREEATDNFMNVLNDPNYRPRRKTKRKNSGLESNLVYER